jgi:hypothetical protein
MKTMFKLSNMIAIVVCLGLYASGCRGEETILPELPTEFPTVTSTLTQTSTVTMTSLPSPTKKATPTPRRSPTSTFTATQTSTPTITPTYWPTLPLAQAQSRLLELLATNGGCQLPCLFGITPGQTTSQEIRMIFDPLSSMDLLLVSHRDVSGYFGFIYKIDDLHYDFKFAYHSSRHTYIVEVFRLSVYLLRLIDDRGYEDVFGSPIFNQMVSLYTLPQILTTYGPPDQVVIRTWARPARNIDEEFTVYLAYLERGFFVKYTMPMELRGDVVIGCPSAAWVELAVIEPGKHEDYQKLLRSVGFHYYDGVTDMMIDVATSLTVDEFYQIYKQPTDACLETPANLWSDPLE